MMVDDCECFEMMIIILLLLVLVLVLHQSLVLFIILVIVIAAVGGGVGVVIVIVVEIVVVVVCLFVFGWLPSLLPSIPLFYNSFPLLRPKYKNKHSWNDEELQNAYGFLPNFQQLQFKRSCR